jgi:hypothetical protein
MGKFFETPAREVWLTVHAMLSFKEIDRISRVAAYASPRLRC